MRRAAALVAVAALAGSGCGFMVRHPPIAAALVAAPIAWGSCELASTNQGACALVGAGAGAFLAGVTALAILLGGNGHTILIQDPAETTGPLQPDPVPAPPALAPDPVPAAPPPAEPPPPSEPSQQPPIVPPRAPIEPPTASP